MQTRILWSCDAENPFSFDSICGLLGAELWARGHGGKLLIHFRSGGEAALAQWGDLLRWLGIRNGELHPFSTQEKRCCCAAAARLITGDRAYCTGTGTHREVFFRLPVHAKLKNILISAGRRKVPVPPGVTVEISKNGITARTGDGQEYGCTFAAMPDLTLYRKDGRVLFRGAEHFRQLMFGKKFLISGASTAEFGGHDALFRHADGTEHHVALELLKDPAIVDNAGDPASVLIRPLAAISANAGILASNSCRGEVDAALEVLLFDVLEYPPPRYLLLPACDSAGAPDVASFRKQGFAPEVLADEFARLNCGYPPSKKVRSMAEWAEIFKDDRSDGFGYRKFEKEALEKLNKDFLASLSPEDFIRRAGEYADPEMVKDARFAELAAKMQPCTELLSEAAEWHF